MIDPTWDRHYPGNAILCKPRIGAVNTPFPGAPNPLADTPRTIGHLQNRTARCSMQGMEIPAMNRLQTRLGTGMRAGLIGMAIVLAAAGCTPQTDDTPPPQIVSALTGQWHQVGGTGTMHFYPDVTVKLMFPDRKPPVQLLTSYDMLKGRVGIDSGGYWTGPIMLDLDLPHHRITLTFPKQKPIVLEKSAD